MIETQGLSMTSAHYDRLGQGECEKIRCGSLEVFVERAEAQYGWAMAKA